ncbi:hypothetical protein D3C73_1163770 [compost metagenome]
MRVSLTPLGGRNVYCVTFGPMLAPSISTSILNSLRVSRIVCAFCCTSPASAGDCFFSRSSMLGAFQFGSLIDTSADCSSAPLSRATLPRRLERWADFFSSLRTSVASSIGTPALSLISAIGAATFGSDAAAALRITFTLASCSAISRRDSSHSFLMTVIGEMRKTNKAVTAINRT